MKEKKRVRRSEIMGKSVLDRVRESKREKGREGDK